MSSRNARATSTLRLAAVALTASLLLSGCFLRSLVANFDRDGGVSISANTGVGTCEPSNVCTYTILDGDTLVDIVSSFVLIAEYGFFGIIVDPLIVQVPAGVSNVTATYNDAGTPLPLVVTETPQFPVTPTMTVDAEPGTKFLILELPDAVVAALPAGRTDFDFTLDFVVSGPASFTVKPMLTASFDEAGTRYYLPLLPCVTDFAQVPSVQLDQQTGFQDVLPQVRDFAVTDTPAVCDGTVYDLRAPGATTTTSTTTSTTSIPATTSIAPTTSTAATTTTMSTTTTTVPSATMPTANTAPANTAPTNTVRPTTELPATGSATTAQLWLALALLSLGALVMWLARHRPARR